jgi:dTDP-4-amino-4,6-dideoxygalactose transaminase
MSAILANIQPGDEVIVPSYTFVSTALAFVRQGAAIQFVDSRDDHPGLDEDKIEPLITPRTKAIVPVHYAGVACDMDKIMSLAKKYGILVIEDAAQSIESFYKGRPLGSIGHLSTFSFHETKNINCGEGGLLAIKDERFCKRQRYLGKRTNRAEFFRGEVNKIRLGDTGSSFFLQKLMRVIYGTTGISGDDPE